MFCPCKVLDTVQEIQERHTAVKDLERQLLGLHQIFLDMAVLVEAQGELLDNIETQVSGRSLGADSSLRYHVQVAKANDYVNQGNKALTSAKALQRNTRKWMCCAVMLLLIIILVVVLVITARRVSATCFTPIFYSCMPMQKPWSSGAA